MGSGIKPEIILPENQLLKDIERAKREKEAEEAAKLFKEAAIAKQEELEKKLETLELLPNGNKLILQPYPENPYIQIATKGGVFTGYGAGVFKNPDSGEMDKEKPLVACAKIIEVGPECKFGRVGDDVFYDTRTTFPVPFMAYGWLLTSEPQILLFLNEGLKERFKK